MSAFCQFWVSPSNLGHKTSPPKWAIHQELWLGLAAQSQAEEAEEAEAKEGKGGRGRSI